MAIWSYIADDSEDAADRFVDLLAGSFGNLGRNPYLGRRRDDLHQGWRSFVVGQYVVVYRIAEPGVRILQVIHGKRDIPGLFPQ